MYLYTLYRIPHDSCTPERGHYYAYTVAFDEMPHQETAQFEEFVVAGAGNLLAALNVMRSQMKEGDVLVVGTKVYVYKRPDPAPLELTPVTL